ncbi:MAG TPA: hypothetical protein VG847_07935 [Chitinophagaceae bacterium]|nr:hypothetical protein [Chitinophagaceae bacterium]
MDLVPIRTFSNYVSANILLTKLRAGGIECYLKDENTVTMDPLLTVAVGGIKLLVKKEDVPEVLRILQQFDNEYRNKAVCPRCGSHNIDLVPKRSAANMVAAILSWLFSSYAVSAENVYKCNDCGYESDILNEPVDANDNFSDPEKSN